MCAYIYTYIYIYVYMLFIIYTCIDTYIYIYIYSYIYISLSLFIYIYIYIYAHIYIYVSAWPSSMLGLHRLPMAGQPMRRQAVTKTQIMRLVGRHTNINWFVAQPQSHQGENKPSATECKIAPYAYIARHRGRERRMPVSNPGPAQLKGATVGAHAQRETFQVL